MNKLLAIFGIFLAAAPVAMSQTTPMLPTPFPPAAIQPPPPSPQPVRSQQPPPSPQPAASQQPTASPQVPATQQPAGTQQPAVNQQPAASQQPPANQGGYNGTVSPGIFGRSLELGAVPAANRSWTNVDYLMWWFKDAPAPVPLVTTSNAADAGIIGNPSTRVLFGNQPLDAGTLSGMRLTMGHWFDDNEIVGFEASGFLFPERNFTNFVMRTNNPNQILAVPYTDPVNGRAAFILSGTNPNNGSPVVGSVVASSSTSLWGAEVNGLLNLVRNDGLQISFVGGFRYLNLQESLNMDYGVGLAPGSGAGPLYNATLGDQFSTSNQFYGGQLGLKAEFTRGAFFGSILGKVALGVNHETVGINGQFSDPNNSFYSTYGAGPGGLFAQQTNIGNYTRNVFAVMPEVQLRVGINIFTNLQVFVGYDFMFLSQVVRPGDQIDPVINPSQAGPNPAGGGTASPLVGSARPMPLFVESNFWAQGVSFGLQFTF